MKQPKIAEKNQYFEWVYVSKKVRDWAHLPRYMRRGELDPYLDAYNLQAK